MQYSDELEMHSSRRRNAELLKVPIRVPVGVTLSMLTPLKWAATNYQHQITDDSLDVAKPSEVYLYKQKQHDPNFATWDLFNSRIG
jgi:hypothetical protein